MSANVFYFYHGHYLLPSVRTFGSAFLLWTSKGLYLVLVNRAYFTVDSTSDSAAASAATAVLNEFLQLVISCSATRHHHNLGKQNMAAAAQSRPPAYHTHPHVFDVRRMPERPSRALIAQATQEQHPDVVKNRHMERRKSSEERLQRPCFEEITEVDEEEASTSDSSTSSERADGRSPYVMTQIHSPATYTTHPLLSPKFVRRLSGSGSGRLLRGNSDPIVRKRSLGSLSDRYHGSSFDQLVVDFLSLPPIPEAGTPASPNERTATASNEHDKLQFIDEKDDLSDSSESSYMTV
ncbi:hypothetical protein L596_000281 [Steinernema carpocapsae]|nr:hypothetical protein L596_000281 [Steinernema carpocapsae]